MLLGALGGDSLFPVQVGPPTQYAREKSRILILILLVQGALMITRCVFSFDIVGAAIMGVQIFTGFCAWQQDMNITYLCIFGIVCFLNGVFSVVMAIIPIVWEAATLQIGAVVSTCLLPIANFAGAYLAHLVWKDWQDKQKQRGIYAPTTSSWNPLPAPSAFGLGSLFGSGASGAENAPLAGSGSLFSGKGYTLGDTDAFLTKAKAYSDQGLQQGQSAWGSATGAMAGYASQAEAGAASFFSSNSASQVQGRHDIAYDPFMTK